VISHPISAGVSVGVVIASLFVVARYNVISWSRFSQVATALMLVIVGVAGVSFAGASHG